KESRRLCNDLGIFASPYPSTVPMLYRTLALLTSGGGASRARVDIQADGGRRSRRPGSFTTRLNAMSTSPPPSIPPALSLLRATSKPAKPIGPRDAAVASLLSDPSESRYVKSKEALAETTVAAMQDRKMPGRGFTPSNPRYYPMGSIAAHILGGTGKDGHGLDGLELQFDQLLAGHDGYKRTLKDARRNPIAVDADDYRPAEHGRHLILTIDANS